MKIRNLACFVASGLVVALAACGEDETPASTGAKATAGSALPPARVALEIDGLERGELVVTEKPAPLESLLPPGTKPLAEWQRIHAVSDTKRFVLASHPGTSHRGQVPMLYLDARGKAVFAMVATRAGAKPPESAAELKKLSVPMRLAGVVRVSLWIDAEAKRPVPPEGQLVLFHRNRRVTLRVQDLEVLVGPARPFGAEGATTRPGEERAGPAPPVGEPGKGEGRKGKRRAGAPMGWPLAELLRKTVLRDGDLVGIRVTSAQGEPIVVEPTWWTDEARFLAVRMNRKGEFVVHGYRLGGEAKLELEVRGAIAIEAMSEGGRGAGGGGGEGRGGGTRRRARSEREQPR